MPFVVIAVLTAITGQAGERCEKGVNLFFKREK